MNEKQAREIVDLWNKVPPRDSIERDARWILVNQSIGYLSALDKAKGLEEALKAIAENLHKPGMACVIDRERAKEALAKYRSEK